jgi:hypothetical protein
MITVMSKLYRAWSSLRYKHLETWMATWMPPELYGGLAGKCTTQASGPVILAFTEAILKKKACLGVSLDFTACFDRIVVQLAIGALQQRGLSPLVCRALSGFYDDLNRIVRVGSAASSVPEKAAIGILQGCSLSILLLNGLMATWVSDVQAHLTEAERRRVVLSVYLDDRNITADTLATLRCVLNVTDTFDANIGAELNRGKCQLYCTQQVATDALQQVMPEAEVTSKPWSLGFALPTGPQQPGLDDAAHAKQLQRITTATRTATKAAALPHSVRVEALSVTYPSQYGYGVALQPFTPSQKRELVNAIEKALLPGRTGRSAAVMWTVLFKGHRFLPDKLTLLSCCRLLHVVWHRCEAHWRPVLREIWQQVHGRRRGEGVTPFHTLAVLCQQHNWTWLDVTIISTPQTLMGPGVTVDFADPDWPKLAHSLREHIRYAILQENTFATRWDMQGAENGVDIEKTRIVINDKHRAGLDHYHLGALRSVLAGGVQTPSRLLAAGLMDEVSANCPHCDSGVVLSLGHALWHCPRWAHLRGRLQDFDEALHPRCLTRCGLVPRCTTYRYSVHFVRDLHCMMARIVVALSKARPHEDL